MNEIDKYQEEALKDWIEWKDKIEIITGKLYLMEVTEILGFNKVQDFLKTEKLFIFKGVVYEVKRGRKCDQCVFFEEKQCPFIAVERKPYKKEIECYNKAELKLLLKYKKFYKSKGLCIPVYQRETKKFFYVGGDNNQFWFRAYLKRKLITKYYSNFRDIVKD